MQTEIYVELTINLKIGIMKIKEVADLLKTTIYGNNENIYNDIQYAFASDLMSDVLTLKTNNVLLVTGLANIQSIRTAEMADIATIIFVRGKKISSEMKELAEETGILLMECDYTMFKTSGILYNAGIQPIY